MVSQCVGSGYCCKTAPCMIASEKYGLGPWLHGDGCPSLRFDKEADRYFCGEVLDATEERREEMKDILHIGAGCCSSLNSDRLEKIRRMRKK